jgi:hypothetical protein
VLVDRKAVDVADLDAAFAEPAKGFSDPDARRRRTR